MSRAPQRVLPTSPGEDGMSKVKVLVRIRPFVGNEAGHDRCVLQLDEENAGNILLQDPRRPDGALQYTFDHCYGSTTSQEDIFKQEIEPSLSSLFNGMNTTIFCTGMTGAGKTHTMQGTREDPGVIPRTVRSVIETATSMPKLTTVAPKSSAYSAVGSKAAPVPAQGEPSCSVSMSYFEIYNEKLYDLLEPKEQDCSVREDVNHKIVIAGLKEAPLSSFNEFSSLFELGLKNRKTAATKLNHVSSRSHALLMLKVKTVDVKSQKSYEAKLFLIDLAGNEDNRKTDNRGARMTESVNINSSLLALAKVVQALNDGLKRIPYRESKLTRLLQDSLGGSSVGIMIANVAPGLAHFLNTYNTLNFATKSRQVVNALQVNANVIEDTSSTHSPTSSSSPTDSTAERKRMLEQWRESKGRPGSSATSLKASTSSSSISSTSQFTTSSQQDSNATELRQELAKLQREHQNYKEQKQAQAKINESYLMRIAQLEKALLEKQSSSAESSRQIPSVLPTVSAPLPGNATPCTKTKLIHQKIATAKNMETIDPTEALQLYSEILSTLKSCGSEYKEVTVKVQCRIDKMLAQCMDAQDRQTLTTVPSKTSSTLGTGKPTNSQSSSSLSKPSTLVTTRDQKPKLGVPSTQLQPVKPAGFRPPSAPVSSTLATKSSLPPVSRTLFPASQPNHLSGKENVSLNIQKSVPSSAPISKKRKAVDDLDAGEKDVDDDDEYMATSDSDVPIEDTPVKRPAKKRKLAVVGGAGSAATDTERDEASARTLIAQELDVLDVPVRQEVEDILGVLNSGDVKRVKALHGIGKVRAEQIVERAASAPFTALEQLVHAGLGSKLIITFVRRNLVEAVYWKKTSNAPGAFPSKPLILEN